MNAMNGALIVLGYLITLLLIRWVLLTKGKQPQSTVAWIMGIVTVPYVGGLLFLVFGLNRLDRRMKKKRRSSSLLTHDQAELSQYQLMPTEEESLLSQRMAKLCSRVGGTQPTFGNSIEVISDTNRTFGLIEQAIRAAERTIHLEYYIWQPDETGTRLRDLLIEKAREGIKVRLLIDGIGSIRMGRRFLRPMHDAGIQVFPFLPGQSFRERWSINLRNHRKIVIVDGQVGFTGGVNIGDEYRGRNRHIGYWRDTHLMFDGPTVLQMQRLFVDDWFHATGEDLTRSDLFPPPSGNGHSSAQFLAGLPAGDVDVFHSIMFAGINESRRKILLATSYFVPTHPLQMALETAAHRGVRVRLLLSGKSAHWSTLQAGRSYYESLLNAGVEIYEYDRGLMHSKCLAIDDEWSLIGSPNFDARSLLLNFEAALSIYDPRVAEQLESQFEHDLKYSRRIEREEWGTRSEWRVLMENSCRLFAPIL